jgi:ATP phosphoribosyltransferase
VEASSCRLILKYHFGIYLKSPSKIIKTSVRIASVYIQIQTEHLPNTNQQGNHYYERTGSF